MDLRSWRSLKAGLVHLMQRVTAHLDILNIKEVVIAWRDHAALRLPNLGLSHQGQRFQMVQENRCQGYKSWHAELEACIIVW
jgi:hypothetical protein